MAIGFDASATPAEDDDADVVVTFTVALSATIIIAQVVSKGGETCSGVLSDVDGAFTEAHTQLNAGGPRVTQYYLINPSSGSHTITASFSGATESILGAFSLKGTATVSPIGTNKGGNSGDAESSASVSITTLDDNSWICYTVGTSTKESISDTGGQTHRWQLIVTGGPGAGRKGGDGDTELKASAGSESGSWSFTDTMDWVANAIEVKVGAAVTPQAVDGDLTFIGNLSRKTKKAFSGGLTFIGDLARVTKKTGLAGGLTFAGDLATKLVKIQTCDGTITFSGALSSKPLKSISGALSFIGALGRRPNKTVNGALSFSGDLSTLFIPVGGAGGPSMKIGRSLKIGIDKIGGSMKIGTPLKLVG